MVAGSEPRAEGTTVPPPALPGPGAPAGSRRLVLPATLHEPVPSAREPVPSTAAQKEAANLVRDMFAAEYVHRLPEERLALARQLLEQAAGVADDPVTRYVLLHESLKIASTAPDPGTAFAAVDSLARAYEVSAVTLTARVLAHGQGALRTPEEFEASAIAHLELAEVALARGQREDALKAATAAAQLSRRTKNVALASRARARVSRLSPSRQSSAQRRRPPLPPEVPPPAPAAPPAPRSEETELDSRNPAAARVAFARIEGRLEGTVLGGFEIQELLGRGGMAEVWRANQKSLGRSVALKLLSAAGAASEEMVERFRLEARAAALLEHPNVVRVIEHGTEAGTEFIAFELVDGPTLEAHLRERGGRIPEREALAVVRGIALALGYAHEKRLVHRDVKPDNVLLTSRGEPKLADLGLARMRDEDARLTNAGVVMGTPHYMAPEQALADTDIDERADLYSLGLVLFRCLTGEVPWRADSALGVLNRRLHEELEDPRGIVPGVSPGAARIVRGLAERERGARYARAADVVRDIDLVLAGEAPLGPEGRPADAPRPRAWGRRRLAFAAAFAVVAGVAPVLASEAVPWGRSEGPAPSPAASPSPEKRLASPTPAPDLRAAVAAVQEASALARRDAPSAAGKLTSALEHATPAERPGLERARALLEALAAPGLLTASDEGRREREKARARLDELARAAPANAVETAARAEATAWSRILERVTLLERVLASPGEPREAWPLEVEGSPGAATGLGPGALDAVRDLALGATAFDRGSPAAALEAVRRCPESLALLDWFGPSVAGLAEAARTLDGRDPASALQALEGVALGPGERARSLFVRGRVATWGPGAETPRGRGWSPAPRGFAAAAIDLAGRGTAPGASDVDRAAERASLALAGQEPLALGRLDSIARARLHVAPGSGFVLLSLAGERRLDESAQLLWPLGGAPALLDRIERDFAERSQGIAGALERATVLELVVRAKGSSLELELSASGAPRTTALVERGAGSSRVELRASGVVFERVTVLRRAAP